MHRTIGYLSKRFIQIRPGEGRKVLLTFLYFFLVITAYYVIKPVSRSLVLGELGSRMVPYVDLICAILMGPIVTLFAKLVDRLPKPRLVSYSFAAVTGVLLVFWKLLHWPLPWVVGAFYVWVAIFSVLVVTLFWLVANDLYRPREAKRLFGFIGSGGILGGIVGSSLAAVGAQVVGTEHLLLLSAALLLCCWAVVQQLWRLAPVDDEPVPQARKRSETFLSDLSGFVKLLLQSRYLMLLIVIVAINKIVATLIYYQLNPFIEQAFPSQDARTTFTGMFFGGLNVLAFTIQFFFTSWILRRWGLLVALLALPIGVLGGTAGLLVVPTLWLAAGTELYDGSLNYSLQQTTKELLYLPIDRSIRYKVKPFIDMVIFRFGKGIAAVIGIVLLDGFGVAPRMLSYVAIPLLLIWIVAAIWLRRDYVATIRTMLQARAVSRRAPAQASAASDGGMRDVSELFGSLLGAQALAPKLDLVDRLVAAKVPAQYVKELVTELRAYETPLGGPEASERDLARLEAIIGDQRFSMGMRRHAIRLLARSSEQQAVDYLCGLVIVDSEAILRHEAVRGLVRMRLNGRRLEFPLPPIRRHIAREVVNYQRIAAVVAICRQHRRGAAEPDDPLVLLLRVLLEESVEQIFRLLMLIYRPEDIHLVFEQLRAADPYLRADAIELLDNLVDQPMRRVLLPILDEDTFLAAIDQPVAERHDPAAAYRLLQEAIWDHHGWLSVTVLCAVGHLRLSTMRPELERASRHELPLISSAAKVAIHLASHA